MSLGKTRITIGAETEFAHEREALDFAIAELPNNDPYQVWGLVELLEPSTGRLYEIDLLVLGYSALYLVEIKSGPGRYTGDSVDWWRQVDGEPARYMENPYRLTNHKAKVLSSMLGRKMANSPWVQPLVFLSHPEASLALAKEGAVAVVTRRELKRALTHHEIPGVDAHRSVRPVNRVQMRELAQALSALGVRPRKSRLHVGEYELGGILEEGPGYQDRAAQHRDRASIKRRARIYLVPQQTSPERRSLLRRAADREAALLDDLREHPGVLQFSGFVADAPLGPTVLFDAFEDGLRLDAFLRQGPPLSFDERIELVAQIGRALGYCHRKSILHGGLSPESVLVRRGKGGLEVRLFNFQLGAAIDRIEATAHVSALTAQGAQLFLAPEVRENPLRRDVEGDVYSLGVLAYFIVTGQMPAADLAGLEARLEKQGELDPRASDDTVPPGVADAIAQATQLRPVDRFNDAAEWVELLLDEATSPDKPVVASFVDPLSAGATDRVAYDLEVVKAIGQGATARVLGVRQEGSDRDLALKVSLGAEHDERIRAEGQTLKDLRHANIVECLEVREVGGRAALLLVRMPTTLLARLADDGTIVLDYALRWGEDLLAALVELEDKGITHRDLKPANIGIGGASKKAERLVVFDLSLSHGDPRALEVGTAAYRDPFLRKRGSWDAAADRWSAALILHEMLTGVRPTLPSSSLDVEAKVALAAERFPAGLRDRLIEFFDRAFARDSLQRFTTAEEMRREWSALGVAPRKGATEGDNEPEDETPTDEQIARIGSETAIASLPLSDRAKNALDRAGALRMRDILRLPENRLSAIRGVGRLVAREILALRDRWRALGKDSETQAVPFFAGYRGEDLPVEGAGPFAEALVDAGLLTFAMVAGAPEEHVAALAQRHRFDVAEVRRVLDAENRRAEERARPTTLEGWIDALLPRKKKSFRAARVLFGLDAAREGGEVLPLGASGGAAARALEQTPPAVYIAIGKLRKDWDEHPAMGELVASAKKVVDEGGGAIPLRDAADKLLATLPWDRSREASRAQIEAGALLRVVTELRRDGDGGEQEPVLPLIRLDDVAWLAHDASLGTAVRALGAAASALSQRIPLASSAEAHRALVEVAGDTTLARLPAEQLAQIAVRASRGAACSTRLELYPRGMDPERALSLVSGLITSGMSPEDVAKRVRDRYPDAAPLPGRPELDALLARQFQLQWDEDRSVYLRPGAAATTTQHTSFGHTSHVQSIATEDVTARDFEERLRHAVEKRVLRVLPVHAHKAKLAEKKLARLLGVAPRALDLLLIERIERHAAQKKVLPDAVHVADREGPAGKNWKNLLRLAELAAADLQSELLPAHAPLLLTNPGLLARYRLDGFLDALVAASKRDDSAAIFLVLPSHDRNAAPVINGELPIPGLLPSERLWIPSGWLTPATPNVPHQVHGRA